jgi:hypothetical protein
MKKTGLILMALALMLGCAGQRLMMMDAMMDPVKVSPGDVATVRVKVVDTKGVVAFVTATVREAPDIALDLNDNGEEGDEVAGDGIWSMEVDVPWDAPAGKYNWDFEAFDADRVPVYITVEGKETLLTAEAEVQVD